MKKFTSGRSRNGKGFYIALALSVAAVGTVTYLTLSRLNRSPQPESSQPNTLENTTSWSIPETSSVTKPSTGVPKDTPTVTPESSSLSKEEPSSHPESSVPTVKPSQNVQKDPGAFMIPVTGDILNPYSNGELVKSKTLKEWRTHDGTDIKAAEGTPVKSVNDGKILDIREDAQWGVTIEAEYPDGITVLYCGLSSDVKVKKGQEVKMGDVLGSVGASGLIESSEESHLHLAMKQDSQWIDPMSRIVTG